VLLEETGYLEAETALAAIGAKVKKPAVFEVNRKALAEGRKFVDQNVWVGPESQADGFAN
jgi:Pyruvate/2-oxoacid:ferredoxin oxidoreductase gamma subunit